MTQELLETGGALTAHESTRLAELESVIAEGLGHFVAVGNALAEINESKLYRQDYATFDDYCQDRWKMGKSHAYRLIGGAVVAERLAEAPPLPQFGDIQPQAESQVRPLASLPPDDQPPAWAVAVKIAGGQPTAAVVEDAAELVRRAAGAANQEALASLEAEELRRRAEEMAEKDQETAARTEIKILRERIGQALKIATRQGHDDTRKHLMAAKMCEDQRAAAERERKG